MKYEYLTNIPLEQAKDDYMSFLFPRGYKPSTERIAVADALSRVAARAVYAATCSPHYNAAAMDGIAVLAKDTFGATETTPVKLDKLQFVPIDTGDPLPDGCDAVVMIEEVVERDGGVFLYAPAAPWQHIRQIGEDISAGDMLVASYERITPSIMGALLAGGVLEIEVIKKPVVGIIPTGDELILPSADPKTGDIIEFNSTIFSAMLSEWGAVPKVYPILRDDREQVAIALSKAAVECDAILISAGTSAGRDDYTPSCIKAQGEVLYHGIAIRPGKPAVLAKINGKPTVGVPGYPVSAIVVLRELFKPVVDALLCKGFEPQAAIEATSSRRINSSLKYEEFVRVSLVKTSGGYAAVPLSRGAGVISSFTRADGILTIPQNSEGVEAGDAVSVRLLRPISVIENSISIIGSHDPLIDELFDMLRIKSGGRISSSHIGSMGGIMAVRRREALLSGVHLLDTKTGEYNRSYVEQAFPNNEAALIECVYRTQGLIVARGNPKNISGFSDITRVSYVNRQNGSGTRILCDYLLSKNGIPSDSVYGYSREELTHTAVAAQIAAGTADAGLGILAAARLYSLSFIPVCEEQYDLLVLRENLCDPRVLEAIELLKSEEFAERLGALGGYRLETPGRVR